MAGTVAAGAELLACVADADVVVDVMAVWRLA
jgi:hypothetical protein